MARSSVYPSLSCNLWKKGARWTPIVRAGLIKAAFFAGRSQGIPTEAQVVAAVKGKAGLPAAAEAKFGFPGLDRALLEGKDSLSDSQCYAELSSLHCSWRTEFSGLALMASVSYLH